MANRTEPGGRRPDPSLNGGFCLAAVLIRFPKTLNTLSSRPGAVVRAVAPQTDHINRITIEMQEFYEPADAPSAREMETPSSSA